MSPKKPVTKKADCQPYRSASQVTIGTARRLPSELDEEKMATGNPRSFFANHVVQTRKAPG